MNKEKISPLTIILMFIAGVFVILALVYITSPVSKNNAPENQVQSPISISYLPTLPNTSAIKQALAKKDALIKEQEQIRIKQQESEARRELAQKLEEKLKIERDTSFVKEYDPKRDPKYNPKDGCPEENYDYWSGTYYVISPLCLYEPFLVDRLSKNEDLVAAFRVANDYNVTVVLSTKFDYYAEEKYFNNGSIKGAAKVKINVNADDQTIIDFLTKNAEISAK